MKVLELKSHQTELLHDLKQAFMLEIPPNVAELKHSAQKRGSKFLRSHMKTNIRNA